MKKQAEYVRLDVYRIQKIERTTQNVLSQIRNWFGHTSQPNWSSVAIFVEHCTVHPRSMDFVVNHPYGGENDKKNKENLKMSRSDLDRVEDASAHYGDSQEKDVQGDESRQKPSPVATLLLRFEPAMGKPRFDRLSMGADLDGGYLVLHGF